MIDFIKIEELPVDSYSLKNTLELYKAKFESKLDPSTGELKTQYLPGYGHLKPYKEKAQYFGLTFYFITNGTVLLMGSLHCFRNKGQHNYNDFSLNHLEELIINLKHTFHFDPTKARINNIEIGVNINLPFSPTILIDSLIMYKNHRFNLKDEPGMYFAECQQTQFFIKVYNKGLQYNLKENVLRFEVKYITTEHLNGKGITTLADLIKPGTNAILKDILIEKYNSILIGDIRTINTNLIEIIDNQYRSFVPENYKNFNQPITPEFYTKFEELRLKDQRRYILGHSFNYWNNIHPKDSNNTDYTKNRSYYNRELKNFNRLLKKTGAIKLKNEVETIIKNKIEQLASFEKTVQNEHRTPLNKPTSTPSHKKQKTVQNERFYYSTSLYHPDGIKEKYCPVTGINITHQKSSSKTTSQQTIEMIRKFDPPMFKMLLKEYGSKRPYTRTKKQCYYIAHNIRNHYKRNQTIIDDA
ncbi:hypothetical protein [Draconibacterium orientale]|uniref:hypothetical protein n=1 Tax=Draconibacterium orientale TaxID=1168034 RepID=UPI0029C0D469|nr:hypothetical protein [Draconibacterium orientale]